MVTIYSVGDLVDIVDENEVYCPGRITDVITNKGKNGNKADDSDSSQAHYMVEYIGWPTKDYPPEEININSDRIKPHKSHVLEYKAWVKFSPTLPHWPSKLYVRVPLEGSKEGHAYLAEFEKRVLVIPYGGETKLLKPYSAGVWFKAKDVRPFNERCEQRIKDIYNVPANITDASRVKKEQIMTCFGTAWQEQEADTGADVFTFAFGTGGSLEINRDKTGSMTAREEDLKRRALESDRDREYKRLRYEKSHHLDLFSPPEVGEKPQSDEISSMLRASLKDKKHILLPPSAQEKEKVNYFAKISALRMLLDAGGGSGRKDVSTVETRDNNEDHTTVTVMNGHNVTTVADDANIGKTDGGSSSAVLSAQTRAFLINPSIADGNGTCNGSILNAIERNPGYIDI